VRLNAIIDKKADAHIVEASHIFLNRIRAYLFRGEQENVVNNVIALVKSKDGSGGLTEIVLGPQIDKGPSDSHFHFDSGARLSFGVTLRRDRRRSHLVAYRFHYVFADGHSPSFVRFDLNASGERPALEESRCHLHPGLDRTRLPGRVLSPFEILDRIFYVLDKCACGVCRR